MFQLTVQFSDWLPPGTLGKLRLLVNVPAHPPTMLMKVGVGAVGLSLPQPARATSAKQDTRPLIPIVPSAWE